MLCRMALAITGTMSWLRSPSRTGRSRAFRISPTVIGQFRKSSLRCSVKGKVGQIGDFCTLELACDGKTKRTKARCDKGHACEIGLTLEPIRRGASPPSHSEELMEVSRRRSLSKKRSATGKFGFLGGPHMLRPGDEFKRRISDCRFVNLRSRSFQILSLKSTI